MPPGLTIKIKEIYQLDKDPKDPTIRLMKQSMRDQIKTQEEFNEKYVGKTPGKIPSTVKVVSDAEFKRIMGKKVAPNKNSVTKKSVPASVPVPAPVPINAGIPQYRKNQTTGNQELRRYIQLDWVDKDDHSKGKIIKESFKQYLIAQGIYESNYAAKGPIVSDESATGDKKQSDKPTVVSVVEAPKTYKRAPKIVITGTRLDETDPVEKTPEKSPESEPDGYDFLYPELDDPNFNIKIAKRKEFYDTRYDGDITDEKKRDVKKWADILCNSEFELTPHQQFVKNFLSVQTPYNSLLLYHGLGTGKTCSAIGVAEEMRTYMKQIGQRKPIIIVAMPNVQDNFRLQLFDPRKLKLENGIWTIQSCIGNSLLREINPTGVKGHADDRDNIIEQINNIINQYYVFMGYTTFANYISSVTEVKGTPEEKQRNKIREIKNVFNNRLVIIDEVHNIRITNENKNRKVAELLMDVAKHSDSMRLLLLSATPLYNSYEEIIWLVNLMNLNDKRGVISISDVFESDGTFKPDPDGMALLKRKLTGYVSYIRGENPYTFPYRIYPEKNPDFTYPTKQMNGKSISPIEHIPVFVNPIGEVQEKGYKLIVDDIKKQAGEQFEDMESFKYTILMLPMEALNIVYPYDETADPSDIVESITGKSGLARIMSYKETPTSRYNFQYKNPALPIFSKDELPKYSSKMAKICETIRASEGIILIYSQYIDGGSVPMALALEEMGFTRFGTERQTKPLFASPRTEPLDSLTMLPKSQTQGSFNQARYVMITGDKLFSPNNDEDIKALNSPDNMDGSKIKVVLISKAAAEGIDFKNIRQVHILEPWYNMNRVEQIIGRGVRNQSHCKLPFEKRNVEIFLHATSLTDTSSESVDLYVYRLAERKSIEIGKITRVLKETAVDCILNIEQTNFTTEKLMAIPENTNISLTLSSGKTIKYDVGDKPFTEICDYMDNCAFTCSPTAQITDADVTEITYNEKFVEINNETIVKRIRDIFKDLPKGRHFFKRDELFAIINILKHYPDSQIFNALTYLIDNKNEHITDKYGRIGNLVNHDEYYMFQPIEITDDAASIYERTRPVDVKLDSVIVKLPGLEKAPEQATDFESILGTIQANYDMALTQAPVEKRKANDKNWYNVVNVTQDYLVKTHLGGDLELLKKYVIYHHLDSLGLADTLTIMNNAIRHNPGSVSNSDVLPLVRKYFKDKTITSKSGHFGIGISKEDKPYRFYTQSSSGEWEPASLSDTEAFMLSDDYSTKFLVAKERISKIFGFMSWVPVMEEAVFKMRDKESTVNTTGARADQAQVKDILLKINTILGSKIYTEENVKSVDSIGEGKNRLVVLAELLLRYKNDVDKEEFNKKRTVLIQSIKNQDEYKAGVDDKDKERIFKALYNSKENKAKLDKLRETHKIWFLNEEQMSVNAIQNIGKKPKQK